MPQQLLGHEKLETTAIYTQVSIAQRKDVHRRTHPAEKPKPPRLDAERDATPGAGMSHRSLKPAVTG